MKKPSVVLAVSLDAVAVDVLVEGGEESLRSVSKHRD